MTPYAQTASNIIDKLYQNNKINNTEYLHLNNAISRCREYEESEEFQELGYSLIPFVDDPFSLDTNEEITGEPYSVSCYENIW